MTDTTPRRLRHCLVVAAATLSLACASARPSVPQQVAPSPAPRNDHRSVAQDECANLQPPATTKLAVHAYATGVQIYRWSGTSWSFVGPEAVLFADAAGRSRIGKLQDRFEALVGDTEPRDVAGPVAAATHRAVAVRAEERRQLDREAHRAAEATAPGRTSCARYGAGFGPT